MCPLVSTKNVTTLKPMVANELASRIVLSTSKKIQGSQHTARLVGKPCQRTKKAVKG